MVIVLLYIWFLLTTPRDVLVCSMWADQLAATREVPAECGSFDHRDFLIWQAVDANTGEVMCTGRAAELPNINCVLQPMNQFRINVVWPDSQKISCSIVIDHEGPPTDEEIDAQCPGELSAFRNDDLILEFMTSRPAEPAPMEKCKMPDLAAGNELLQQPQSVEELATAVRYDLLAGELLWHGVAKADCGGLSGLNPVTRAPTDCGLQSALPQVIAWQNQWDGSILSAANNAKVPAKLLKKMMSIESQFWPWWVGPKGEYGLIQITDVGFDTALLYSDDLFERYCPRAVYPDHCTQGYAMLSPAERKAVLDAVRAAVSAASSGQIGESQTAEVFQTYADVLAAYYCFTGEVTGTPTWEQTLAVYHAGAGCVSTGEICRAGQVYIDLIKK